MGGRLPGADDLASLFPGRNIHIRPGVNDEQNHMSDETTRLPAIPVRVRAYRLTARGSPNTSRTVSKLRPWSRLLVRFFSLRPIHTVPVCLCNYRIVTTLRRESKLVQGRSYRLSDREMTPESAIHAVSSPTTRQTTLVRRPSFLPSLFVRPILVA
jgi:hypothetical protein